MAVRSVTSPKHALWHPTWLIPFMLLCVLAGVLGCLNVLDRL